MNAKDPANSIAVLNPNLVPGSNVATNPITPNFFKSGATLLTVFINFSGTSPPFLLTLPSLSTSCSPNKIFCKVSLFLANAIPAPIIGALINPVSIETPAPNNPPVITSAPYILASLNIFPAAPYVFFFS